MFSRDLSDSSRMLYHWAISPLQTDSKTSLQTRASCLSTVRMFFGPSQVYSRDQCHFSLVFQKLYKGTPGFGPGGLQLFALPLSYIPAAYRFNNITANTLRLFEHWYQVFCSEYKGTMYRSMSFFSSLSKINKGPLGLQPIALPLSYIPAADSIILQTTGCLSTAMFFVPSQVYCLML